MEKKPFRVAPMSKFESTIKQIPHPQQAVYRSISDLSNLERVKDRVPADKIKDFSFDSDTVSLNVDPVGAVTFKIVNREEPKCVKFEGAGTPLPIHLWIQVLPVSDTTSKMKLTVEADIPIFVRPMVEKPLKEGIERIADVLAMVDYGE